MKRTVPSAIERLRMCCTFVLIGLLIGLTLTPDGAPADQAPGAAPGRPWKYLELFEVKGVGTKGIWTLADGEMSAGAPGSKAIFRWNRPPARIDRGGAERPDGISIPFHVFGRADRDCLATRGDFEPRPKTVSDISRGHLHFRPKEDYGSADIAELRIGLFEDCGGADEKPEVTYRYRIVRDAAPVAVDVPDLPLVIPADPLEGTLKALLIAKKQEVLQHLQAAKAAAENQPARRESKATGVDSLEFLSNWYDANRGVLADEEKARKAAETFFALLAASYDRLTDAERARVENGLLDRGLALRRARTVQRGIMRDKSGASTAFTAANLEAYFGAVSRATWATLELDALVRMWGPINAARTAHYAAFNPYEGQTPGPATAAGAAQRRHFEALVDTGIAALLGSENRFEATIEARKDRLFNVWESAEFVKGDASRVTRFKGMMVDLFSAGFTVFDIGAGLGADAFKVALRDAPITGRLLDYFGVELKTRAEKLDKQASDNWDRTLRKLAWLRLLKTQPWGKIRDAAQAAADVPLTSLDLIPGKPYNPKDPDRDEHEITLFMEDRAFVDATSGGLLRLLSPALGAPTGRCRMELLIAREQTRLIRRDMEAADRVARGREPDTGELSWGTILSPAAWGDVASKVLIDRIGPAKDLTRRATEIAAKGQQMVTMAKLEAPLMAAEFRIEELPPEAWAEHVRLYTTSAPYIDFVVKCSAERRALALHDWLRELRDDIDRFPEAAERKKFYDEQVEHFSEAIEREDRREINRLKLEDYIIAWDLSGALSLAEDLARRQPHGPEEEAVIKSYAGVAKLLREEVAQDRVKNRAIAFWRNVGDIGFFGWAFQRIGKIVYGASTAPRVSQSFARYVFEAANPFTYATTPKGLQPRAARAVLSQSATEVLVDLGLPATGQKYEALLNQVLGLVVDKAFDRMAARAGSVKEQIKAAWESEKAHYRGLDNDSYLASLLNRVAVKALERAEAFREAMARVTDADIRASLERQVAYTKRLIVTWVVAAELTRQANALRGSLRKRLIAPHGAQAEWAGIHQALEATTMPPTRSRYERLLRERSDWLFDPDKGYDIDKLRKDFKDMRHWIRPEDRPALDRLEAQVDDVRHQRFLDAMGDFLAAPGGPIEPVVILNGTMKGNPEYKGIFSDKDFTIIVKPGADRVAIRQAADLAFKKHGLLLNEKDGKPSADIEPMLQEFLPGEVRPIRTWQDFEEWALKFARDPARYLTAGGDEWVGYYNYLSGGTLRLAGGKAVVDAVPDPRFILKPDLDPLFAHGLVLDNARLDKLPSPSKTETADSIAEMIGKRAKYVLRCADALIWVHDPAAYNGRTRQAAEEKGYHRLMVDDARQLMKDGLLTPEEFQLIRILADVKSGSTIFQALGIDASKAEANRQRLEKFWGDMNALMRRAYEDTRDVYKYRLRRFANIARSERARGLLMTVPLRSWHAARTTNDKDHPDTLNRLTAQPGDVLAAIKREDQEIVGLGKVLDTLPADPPAEWFLITRADHPRDVHGVRPAEGADPATLPTGLEAAAGPAPPAVPRFELKHIFAPMDLRAYRLKSEQQSYAYFRGEKVAFIKNPVPNKPFGLVNDVVAWRFALLFGTPQKGDPGVLVNIPATQRVRLHNGAEVAVMRRVPGQTLADVLKNLEALSAEARARLKDQRIKDRLVSALLGDHDRNGVKAIVTDNHDLVNIDHEQAVPFEADPARYNVAEQMYKRFLGESRGDFGRRQFDKTIREIDDQLGLTYEDMAKAWQEMKPKLREDLLKLIALEYGQASEQVLKTWNRRSDEMDHVLREIFKKPLPTKGMVKGEWPGVEYHESPQEREEVRLTVGRDGKLLSHDSQTADTLKFKDLDGRVGGNDGIGIYVIDGTGRLYMDKGRTGKVHHSTFLAGQPVAFAGQIRIEGGRLKYIDLDSGHYQHPAEARVRLKAYLQEMGIDVSQADIQHLKPKSASQPTVR